MNAVPAFKRADAARSRIDEMLAERAQEEAAGPAPQFACLVMADKASDHPEPLDIFRTTPAPTLDPACFPECIREYAVPLARAAGHDVGAYLVSCLVATAGAADDATRIALDLDTGWFESPRLWGLLLGPPGSAKTPAIRAGVAPLHALHRERRQAYEAELAGLGKDEKPPPPPSIYTNDPTLEALSDVLAANPRGLIAVYEELDSWLGAHDAYRNGGGSKDRGEWLRLYDGGPHQVDRVKRGSVFVRNWGVSLLGATTPAGLKRHARDLPPDGLIQRFLPVLVRHAGEHGSDAVDRSSIKPARERYEARLRELAECGGGVVYLMPEAKRIFSERCRAVRAELQAVADLSEPLGGHLAKHPGMIARVALVHHLAQFGAHAADLELTEDTMAAAVRLVRDLGRHALGMFEMLSGNDAGSALGLARAAARAILASRMARATRNDLMQACRAFRDAGEGHREEALRFLVDAAWLLPEEGGRMYGGKPAAYAVHHAVHGRFAAEGDAQRARRQAVRELLHG